MPILHGISYEHNAMHATQLFLGWSGVPHAHVECAPRMGNTGQKKYSYEIDYKFFSEGCCFDVLA